MLCYEKKCQRCCAIYQLRLSLLTEDLYRSLILASGDHPDENIRPCLVISYDTCDKPNDRFHFELDNLHCNFQYDDPSVTSWNWFFGEGYGSSLQNPEYTFTEEGTYYVCLEVANNCDTITICDSVTVCLTVMPSFSYKIVDSLKVKFINQSNCKCDFYWDFGNGYYSILENPEILFTEGGLQNVCLYVTNDCGMRMFCDTINLNSSLGLENFRLGDDLSVYPNPAKDFIYIQSGSRKILRIELYNDQGMFEEVSFSANTDLNYKLPLQHSAPGLYFLRLITKDGCIIKRIIVL